VTSGAGKTSHATSPENASKNRLVSPMARKRLPRLGGASAYMTGTQRKDGPDAD